MGSMIEFRMLISAAVSDLNVIKVKISHQLYQAEF